eukprot:TRINITY_DN29839_c0_g1_i1.p1 TRINITY_DN29839_c0_g1~~TRINITY_DN29839_c0_g1_i1.p1  ORF type:complete len:109 (-),score=17.58 TRINITY_DN29839_c0_g1_i1:65-391(-)
MAIDLPVHSTISLGDTNTLHPSFQHAETTSCAFSSIPSGELGSAAWSRSTDPGMTVLISSSRNMAILPLGCFLKLGTPCFTTLALAHSKICASPVSYTHMTLPTKRIV